MTVGGTSVSSEPDVARFDALARSEAEALLAACLPVPRWVGTVADGRPYGGWGALSAAADAAATHLDDAELGAALAAHPRIGERASHPEHRAELSAREQSGVDSGDPLVAAALAAGNQAYERRFDRVFIIRAAGRDATEVLGELERRLLNDDVTERAETVGQLREIALLRLRQAVS
jgi:2-oxo-4-hydroxy-4-carboxy-5-ureidoimidazoline decarboxylase